MNSWMGRFWRCLLWAYPPDFRQEYGPELMQALGERLREVRGIARLRFVLNASADLITTASKERFFDMYQELLHSFRRLAAHPGVTAVAILSLALGIGANSAMFSIIQASLLRPLPYPNADGLVMLETVALNSPNRQFRGGVASADFLDWRDQATTLDHWHMGTAARTETALGEDLPERIVTQNVTSGLLESLGVPPVAGRFFRKGEEAAEPAVISEGYWQRRWGSRPDVLGSTITVSGKVYTIVGVLPDSFELMDQPGRVDLWHTIDLSPGSNWVQRAMPWMWAIARLKPGVSREQAQAEMEGIAAGLAQGYPATNRYRGVAVTPMREARNAGTEGLYYPLFGAVSFVLLIACANVANLLLARAMARQREISVRAALGASRWRLIREFLADGVVLAIPGVGGGLLLAYAGVVLFRAVAPDRFPGAATVAINVPVLMFTAAVAALAGILSALFPALAASKVDMTESLKEGARGSSGRKRRSVRYALVAGEIALAVVLLAGAGLMINSLLHIRNHELGIDPENVTIAEIDLTGKRYMTDAPKRESAMRTVEPATPLFVEHILREVRALPGVEHAAMAGNVPMGPYAAPYPAVRVVGQSTAQSELRRAVVNTLAGDFFEALRIPLRAGRYLDDKDRSNSAWAAVVNEAFVREFFPDGQAIGHIVTLVDNPEDQPREIVGIVADYTQQMPSDPVSPEIYTSHFQQPKVIPGNYQGQRFRSKLVVRSHAPGTPTIETIQRVVADFDKTLAISSMRSLEWHIRSRSATIRFYTNALALFSGIALLLAAIGIYGLMSYSVTDRLHEIGIRLSLGATRWSILWLILRATLRLIGAGLLVGIAGALMAGRVLETFLFGVKPSDPPTFLLVVLFLTLVGVTAALIPARRATAVDALNALRSE